MSNSADSAALLSHVPADGSAIGNMKLREALGWDEDRYLAARQPLLDQGILVTGRGRGGAVMRNGAAMPDSAAAGFQALEMFAPEEVTSPAPPRRAGIMDTTIRQCYPTQRSQVDQVVLDTQTWEQSVAHQVESSDAVSHYVRNDHMGFSIPYEYMGVSHAFFPDFIVKLKNGVSLILEVKGLVDDREKAKFEAAKRWCSAVNNWGKMGTWQFHAAKDPNHLAKELEFLARQSVSPLTPS